MRAYHRPQTMQEALSLIRRSAPHTVPLGGGTLLSHSKDEPIEVVDLQALGLEKIAEQGKNLNIGATATLQSLLEHPNCPAAMQTALRLEAPLNLRNAATIAGSLVACDGRSTLVTVLLALDARLSLFSLAQTSGPSGQPELHGASQQSLVNLGDYLPLRAPALITGITIPLQARLAFDYVSRTPADKPVVCIALAIWPSGRARLAVGGWGSAPRLAMDGTEAAGLDAAARNALHDASDEWGSAEYRVEVGATLADRCLAALSG